MKKIISLILCITIIFVSAPAVFAQSADYDDVKGLLKSLEIITDSQDDDSVITRAKVLSLCEKAFGMGNIDISDKYEYPAFTDVSVEHMYYNEIMIAYDLAYIHPDSKGRFMPDSPATVDDVVVFVLNFLGYRDLYNIYGDKYLSMYYKVANTIKLLKDVKSDSNIATHKVANQIVYNALFLNITDDINKSQKFENDENVLSQIFDVKYGEGVLTADAYFSTVTDLAEDNCVIINGKMYYCGSQNLHDYIGKSVCFYYRDTALSSYDEIVYIYSDKDKVVKLLGENVDYSSQKIKNTESGKTKTYLIDAATSVIYNNRLITFAEYDEAFSRGNSRITLIENSNDGVYDVVIIESAKIIEVDTYNPSTDILTSTSGDIYDFSKYKTVLIQSYYGDIIYNRGSINSGMILAVIDPKNEDSAITFRICDKTVMATVDEIAVGKDEITLDNGVVSKISSESLYKASQMRAGYIYTLYYDNYEEVVFAKLEAQTAYKVGFLAAVKEYRSIDSTLKVKIYTQNDTMAVYDVAKQLKYRDKYGEFHKSGGFAETMEALSESGSIRQPIAYIANNEGVITEILVLAVPERDDLIFHEVDWRGETESDNTNMKFSKSDNSFGNRIQFTTKTQYFVVPNDNYPNADDSDYMKKANSFNFLRIGASNSISKTNYYPYAISMSENGFLTDYFYWSYPFDQSRMSIMPAYTLCMIADTKFTSNKEEGGKDLVVTLINSSGNLTDVVYKASDGSYDLKDLNGQAVSKGDIVLNNRDYDGSLADTTMQLYYRASDKKFFREAAGTFDFYSTYRIARVIVGKKQDGYCKCTCIRSNGATTPEVMNFAQAKVYTYDLAKGEATFEGSALNNLSENEDVIMIVGSGVPSVVIKYE